MLRALAGPARRRILDLLAELIPELVSSGTFEPLVALRAAWSPEREGRNQRHRIDAEAFQISLEPRLRRYDDFLETSLRTLKDLLESGEEAP